MPDDEQADVEVPEDEQDVVEMISGEDDSEPTEQEKNLAIAQAELIGDL
jgi:hypothetical protein